MRYEAIIYRSMTEDDYEQGEMWGTTEELETSTVTADTPEDLRHEIEQATGEKWGDINRDDANEYPTKAEYWAGYTADEYGLHASPAEIEQWKKGERKLYAVSCHILAYQLTEAKVKL